MTGSRHIRIAIIGAGASGIMAIIKLREAGIDDVTAFEKADDLGGTWRDNTYPGLTCDVPSLAYRYSFAPNPDWSHVCAPGAEIQQYLRDVARQYDVERCIRYGHEVVRAEFSGNQWHLQTSKGDQGAFDVVLTATGLLHHPVMPDIPGLEDFRGAAFHTARWDHDVTLKGKRVGVIGTGSTATQVVGAVVDEVSHLALFQRTAQWILPLVNDPITQEQRQRYRADPQLLEDEYRRLCQEGTKFAAAIVGEAPRAYASVARMCAEHLQTVLDPELRARLTPDYKVGCKRLIVSGNFYQSMQRSNVALVTGNIERFVPEGILTKDGCVHELDVIVLATGFDTHRLFRPMQVIGREGTTLEQAWASGNQGYMAVTVPGFPNFFMIGGPHSPIGNFSWMLTAENQFGYALKLIELLRSGKAAAIAPKPQAAKVFNDAIRAKLPDTIWATGCSSWYIDRNGNIASWPWTYEKFEQDMSQPVLDDFEIA